MHSILVISHCILNCAAKVEQDESLLAEEYAVRAKLLRTALDYNVQLLQLPCPEVSLFGTRRWGHVKDQFDFPYFRQACRTMLEPLMLQLEDYCANPERFEVIGIVSVEGSPSCGHMLTCRGTWGGELDKDSESHQQMIDTLTMAPEPGVFMEEVARMLEERQLDVPIVTMNEALGLI